MEAQAAAQKIEVQKPAASEPENHKEMAKQPATWVQFFSSFASLLHQPYQKARDGIAALLSTADTISAVPELIPAVQRNPMEVNLDQSSEEEVISDSVK